MGVVDPGEPAGVDQRSSADFLRRTAAVMTRKAPALADVTVIRQWAGMYDISPDHQPLVGPTRQLHGLVAGERLEWPRDAPRAVPRRAARDPDDLRTTATRLEMFDPDRFDPAAAVAGETST